MKLTRILLDIDGTLTSPGAASVWGGELQKATIFVAPYSRADEARIIVEWSPRAIDAIRRIAVRPDVAVAWFSTWGAQAHSVFAPLVGLPEIRYAVLPPNDPLAQTAAWKYVAIADEIFRGSPPLIVIDDRLDDSVLAGIRARAREFGSRFHVVRPDPMVGITPGEVDRITAWVERD
ncbi:HAD domain-containing protein [Agromyces subbeticus]|uniref:HAD domain-containing protein n=1 Tax=Agromyces subbeticus TaxID=293890 RepID=UPI0003B3DA0F|nr:HAD domain-containing protein [Agromyces subbeticus]